MNRVRRYLDWNATAPLRHEAKAAMVAAMDLVGNPSSPHAEGRRARAMVEDAREQVAALVGVKPAQVVFTSGGTEGNNAVLAGGWAAILAANIEHDSILTPLRKTNARRIELAVDGNGVIRQEELPAALAKVNSGASLLTLQIANNETGALQPVAEAARLAKAHGVAVHTDAVQAAGRIHVDFGELGVDYLTLSAHKLGGPKGAGAVVVSENAILRPLIVGGGQERRRRAGTENVIAIAGFGAAAAAALSDIAVMPRVLALRDRLEEAVRAISPQAVVLAKSARRLPNTTSLALPGAAAETLVIALDLAGVAISAGAACSSGKVGSSHVLSAMGIDGRLAHAAIRISLGQGSTESDVAGFLEAWTHVTGGRERAVA